MPAFVAAASLPGRGLAAACGFTPATTPRAAPRRPRVPPTPCVPRPRACAQPESESESESAQPSNLPPPTSVDDTAARAAAALDAALAAGARRVRVTALVPGLNPIAEDTYPFNAALQASLARALVARSRTLCGMGDARLLFGSAGEAAAASAVFAREAAAADDDGDETRTESSSTATTITTGSFAGRDFVDGRVSPCVNVLVAPTSSRGDPVMDDLERLFGEDGDDSAVWVLFNDRLDVDRAAVGIGESTRRAAYVSSFVQAFYFRNLFEIQRPRLIAVERGAMVFAFGGQWAVFGMIDDEYVQAGLSDDMPTRGALDAMVRRTRGVAAQRKRRLRAEMERAAGGGDEGGGGLGAALNRLFGR